MASPRMSGRRAVAGKEADTSMTGVRIREARRFLPRYAAAGIVHARAAPYAKARRERERTVAPGILEAAGGRGRNTRFTIPMRPAPTTKTKMIVNNARSIHRKVRIMCRWALVARSRRVASRAIARTAGLSRIASHWLGRGNRGRQLSRWYGLCVT